MAESGNESDFASAESDQEELTEQQSAEQAGEGGVKERPMEGDKHRSMEEKEEGRRGEGGRGEMEGKQPLQENEPPERSKQKEGGGAEGEGEKRTEEKGGGGGGREDIGEERRDQKEVSPSSPPEKEAGGRKSDVESGEGKKGEEGEEEAGKKEQQQETEAEAGGDGGWGWGGWGKTLWSSVSTMTGSAQALGQKVTAAITTVEDALGLPTPHDLAKTEEEGEGEAEKKEEGGEGEEAKESKEGEEERVKTLAQLAGEVVEQDVPSQSPAQDEAHSIPEGTEQKPEQTLDELSAAYGAFSGFLSGIATAVEEQGIKLVSGGLDALENIGKKTIEVLTEGDPGLQKKRKLLNVGDAPSLSQLLREAREEAEAKQKQQAEAASDGRHTPLSYSSLFDEYQGLVHLEALELLSREYEAKVRSSLPTLTGEEGEEVHKKMEQAAQALTIEEQGEGLDVLDDDSGKLAEVVELFSDVTLPLKVEKLIKTSDFWREKLSAMSAMVQAKGAGEREEEKGEEEVKDEEEQKEGGASAEKEVQEDGGRQEEGERQEEEEPKEKDSLKPTSADVYENGLRGLVQLTSVAIELFRKMAEVTLLPKATKANTVEQAERFNRLTVLVSSELDALASVHAEVLTDMNTKDVNSTIASLYLESSNSASYVQDALQLLKPVLQFSLLQEAILHEPPPNVHTRS